MKKIYCGLEINLFVLTKDVIMNSDQNVPFDNVVEDPFI